MHLLLTCSINASLNCETRVNLLVSTTFSFSMDCFNILSSSSSSLDKVFRFGCFAATQDNMLLIPNCNLQVTKFGKKDHKEMSNLSFCQDLSRVIPLISLVFGPTCLYSRKVQVSMVSCPKGWGR